MKKYWGLLTILILSFFTVRPLLQSGFFSMHDNTQVARVYEMAEALKDGQFPVRWVADLGYGYGYPIFNFYAPLAYYTGSFLSLIGFDALVATKLMMILGIIFSGVTMYFLAREFWGEIGGVLSGVFYLYAPYRALDIYVRGALSELWAMAFLPLVFLAIFKIFKGSRIKGSKNFKYIIGGGLALAAVILSHNLTALILSPFLILTFLTGTFIVKNKKYFVLCTFYFVLLLLALSAFYWLPAITEMNLTKVAGQIGGGADWRDHFVYFDQLWASPWGFGGSAPGRLDGMSFMIGKWHLVIAIFSLVTAGWAWRKKDKKSLAILLIAYCLLLISVFMTNKVSWPIWEFFHPLAFVQYPWRFLIFTSLFISFLAGSMALLFENKPRLTLMIGGGIIFFLLMFNIKYFQPQEQLSLSAADYLTQESLKWETSKISDEYLPKNFPIPQNKNEVAWQKVAVINGNAKINNLTLKSNRYQFQVKAETESEILLNTAYFPNWQVLVDNRKHPIISDDGKIKLSVPSGEHLVMVRLFNTSARTIGNFVSFSACLGIVTYWLLRRKNRNKIRAVRYPCCLRLLAKGKKMVK